MDKALEHLARRLDLMEGQLSLTLNTTTKMVHLLDVRLHTGGCYKATETQPSPPLKQVTRVVRHRPPTAGLFFETLPEKRKSSSNFVVRGPSNGAVHRLSAFRRLNVIRNGDQLPQDQRQKSHQERSIPPVPVEEKQTPLDGDKMEKQLSEVVKRVAMIDSKLSNLQEQLDTNSITRQTEELMASASESYRIGIGLGDRLQAVEKRQDLGHIEDSIEDVRTSVQSVNRRLQIHADETDRGFVQVGKNVSSVVSALHSLISQRRKDWCVAERNVTEISTELGGECVSPLVELQETSDKILNSMVRTQDLETLETTLLTEEQHAQGKILEELKNDMEKKTTIIFENLFEVKKELRRLRMLRSDVNPVAFLQKTTGSNHRLDNGPEVFIPPSDILDEHAIFEGNDSNGELANGDRGRNAGVVFPQKHKKPGDAGFLSSHHSEIQGYSCLELLKKGQNESGTYHLKIRGTTYWFLQVYCDMTTAGGGWTVIQRRDDFGEPRENFNRGWSEYKHGFGNLERELWLGNENIYMLTNTDEYVLRVELEDFDGSTRYAEYSTFKLHEERSLYKLEIGGYNGTAGDSLNDPWYGSNLSPFSTLDKDNDRSSLNCAAMLKGGWWWRSCGRGLNGLYLTSPDDFTARQGIVWFRWRGWDYTLKKTVLMIRPRKFDEESGVS